MSQVQRVLNALGVESIAAQSPEAKGRVERLWQTLQDRLVKEMGLCGIATQEAANAFLPAFLLRFNARFSHEPRDNEPVWVSLPPDLDLAFYFSVVEQRTVRADQTLSYLGRTLLLQSPSNLAGKRVGVHVTPEGELLVYWGKERLDYGFVETTVATKKPVRAPSQGAVSAPPQAKAGASARRGAWLFGQGDTPPAPTESLSS